MSDYKVCMFVYHINFIYKILSAGHYPPFGKTYIYVIKQSSDDRKVNPIVTGTPKSANVISQHLHLQYHNISKHFTYKTLTLNIP